MRWGWPPAFHWLSLRTVLVCGSNRHHRAGASSRSGASWLSSRRPVVRFPTANSGKRLMRAVADTSVIVAAALRSGAGHRESRDAIRTSEAGAAGHAWVESFSVLTRLPPDVRLSAADAARVLGSVVGTTRYLSSREQLGFTTWVRQSGVVGGAVYDALVGWAARCAELPLLTRDARALPTYRSLGIETFLIDPTLA